MLPGRSTATCLAWCCQAGVTAAWLWLAAVSVLGAPGSPAWPLSAVTGLAALSCWVRALVVPADRAAWTAFAVALTGYAAGFVILFFVTTGEGGGPFGVNWSDTASLVLYPAGYLAVVLITRRSNRRVERAALLDGLIVALACAGISLALAARIHPGLLAGSAQEAVYALAYVAGGATLLLAALSGLALDRWRADRVWVLLLLAFTAWTLGDGIYGVQSVVGAFRFGTPLDCLYTLGPVLVSYAAWARPRPIAPAKTNALARMLAPLVAALAALFVLVDRDPQLPQVSVVLSAVTVALSAGRAAVALRREHRLLERALLGRTDDLTGLANRRGLLEALAARPAGEPYALLAVDLPVLAEVLDSFGHDAVDRLLVEIASRLGGCAGPGGVVARLDGRQLAVLVVGAGPVVEAAVAEIGLRLRSALPLDGSAVHVHPVMGLTTGPVARGALSPREAASETLRRARVALEVARRGRLALQPWLPAHDAAARDRLNLLSELTTALAADDQIVVHLQTKHEPVSRRLVGLEALVRWQHPVRGLLAPGHFVDHAEAAGMLPALTWRVLERSLAHVAELRRRGHVVPVAVNVGAPDLVQPEFAAGVGAALDRHGLPASALRIEVTETAVMTDPEPVLHSLHSLRALGVRLSLDDYGTGLSSLSYLRTLPVDELKIDRSFVARVLADDADALIVESTTSLAHGLGITVVAEGVEDELTLTAVAGLGCDEVQGFLLGRPVPMHQLLEQLAAAPVPGPRAARPARPGLSPRRTGHSVARGSGGSTRQLDRAGRPDSWSATQSRAAGASSANGTRWSSEVPPESGGRSTGR